MKRVTAMWFETVNAQSRERFKTKKNKIVVCAGGGGESMAMLVE